MEYISYKMGRMLERLAEMFPTQHYQSELERYIASKHPQTPADIEHHTKEYEHRKSGGGFL